MSAYIKKKAQKKKRQENSYTNNLDPYPLVKELSKEQTEPKVSKEDKI